MILAALCALLTASAAALDYASYRATPADIATLEAGLAGAFKVQKELFPAGIGEVDVVLYDAKHVWLWSRKERSLPKVRSWRGYSVYRVAHDGLVDAANMHGCRGGLSPFVELALGRENLAAHSFECSPFSPWVPFHRAKRGSIYHDREGYLATVVHEFAHQYHLEHGDNPVAHRIWEQVKGLDHPKPYAVISEGYAIWCELMASRRLYPAFFEKLKGDLSGPPQDPHVLGQKYALRLLRPS